MQRGMRHPFGAVFVCVSVSGTTIALVLANKVSHRMTILLSGSVCDLHESACQV